MIFILVAIFACLFSLCFTWAIQRGANSWGILDKPTGGRKTHERPTPLLGGVALYAAFVASLAAYYALSFILPIPRITDIHVHDTQLIGIVLAGLVLVIGGTLDDVYDLKPAQQIVTPLLAIAIVLVFGIGVTSLTNPITRTSFELSPLWSQALTAFWLLGAMYTTKFLDGLDGLVSGMNVIGAFIMALLSLLFFVNIPTALLACIVVGIFAGFLVFNFHPAQIFLGESGSMLAGFFLGILSIISGAKFATALLILGIPIFDAAWVIFQRVVFDRRSPFVGDRKHIHFRLRDAGFSHRQSVLILYACAASFGVAALFLQTQQKVVGILMLLIVFIVLGVTISLKKQQ